MPRPLLLAAAWAATVVAAYLLGTSAAPVAPTPGISPHRDAVRAPGGAFAPARRVARDVEPSPAGTTSGDANAADEEGGTLAPASRPAPQDGASRSAPAARPAEGADEATYAGRLANAPLDRLDPSKWNRSQVRRLREIVAEHGLEQRLSIAEVLLRLSDLPGWGFVHALEHVPPAALPALDLGRAYRRWMEQNPDLRWWTRATPDLASAPPPSFDEADLAGLDGLVLDQMADTPLPNRIGGLKRYLAYTRRGRWPACQAFLERGLARGGPVAACCAHVLLAVKPRPEEDYLAWVLERFEVPDPPRNLLDAWIGR